MLNKEGEMDNQEYKVGYKKPPRHSQFKKGSSGNQKGRPKGTRNLKTDLAEELAEQIVVREGERTLRVSKQRALVKTLVARTLKGEVRPATMLLNLVLRLMDPKAEEQRDDEPLNQMEMERLEVIQKRLLSASAQALTPLKSEQGGEEGK